MGPHCLELQIKLVEFYRQTMMKTWVTTDKLKRKLRFRWVHIMYYLNNIASRNIMLHNVNLPVICYYSLMRELSVNSYILVI
jgi:hypothetical protein